MQRVLKEIEAQIEPYQAVVESLDDASRRASSGGHGLCLGGGHRSEPV